MIRTVYDSPESIDWAYLESQIRTVRADLLAINNVDGQIAVYFETSLTEQQSSDIETIISSHDSSMAPYPPLDATGSLATLLVVLNVIPIEDAANVIHEEPEHLVAEAEAWSLG
jgi:hypothetical protein